MALSPLHVGWTNSDSLISIWPGRPNSKIRYPCEAHDMFWVLNLKL
uniref:Uncharacterized protein n=1 Tax=Arundo donax TaxID=35708 RepID=A0A0A9BIH6_ARUDO